MDEPLLPPDVHVTSDIAYVRWHGRGERPWFNYKYSEEQLTEWVPRVQEAAGRAGKLLGYFNSHFHGYAPENCLQIMEMLVVVTPHGTAALRRVRLRGKGKEIATEPKGLEAWTGPIIEKGVENLLQNFSSQEVLDGARCILESDLSLREDSRRHPAAYVADTTVDIDLEQHTIIHRCPIWARSISEKKFCQHVARVFLIIYPDRAWMILSLLSSSLEDWQFESRLAVELPK